MYFLFFLTHDVRHVTYQISLPTMSGIFKLLHSTERV